jgi:hypothetical protein
MSGENELWYVQVKDGTVHPATLEQIDDAFNAGHIGADTMVLAAGDTQWQRLGELAGLDAPPPPPPPPARVSVAVPVARPQPQPRPYVAPAKIVPSSLRPMTFDLDADDDVAAMRPKSGAKRFFGAMVALAVIGGLAFAATHASGLNLRTFQFQSAAAAAPAPPPPAPAPAPPPDPQPNPVAAPSAPPVDATPRFSDDQKQRLLAADKARDEQTKTKARTKFNPGTVHQASRTSSKSQGFTTSGNKFDPLNASF